MPQHASSPSFTKDGLGRQISDGERAAVNVLADSLVQRSSQPLAITPIVARQLGGIFQRERNPKQSTVPGVNYVGGRLPNCRRAAPSFPSRAS